MEKITMSMLQGEGSKTLAVGVTTDKEINYYGWGDEEKKLKFVVRKGFIDDWCIYVEAMDRDQTYEDVVGFGNKVSPETARLLVDCDDEVIGRYRL